MNIRFLLLLSACLGLLSALTVHAQTADGRTSAAYRYADDVQLWRQTLNAAALTHDSTADRGTTSFTLSRRSGSHHLVQEGRAHNNLRFHTESYKQIGKYLHAYGRFTFDMGRFFDRAWSDVLRPQNSNPYISGSSIAGRYDLQDFDLSAALGTTLLGRFTYGLRLDYRVADFSRLRDPRSRVNLLDYRLTPSATYHNGSHTFGLSLYYHRRKEKLLGLTTVQTDPNLRYYTFTGMENGTGAIGAYSSFQRQFVQHHYGAEVTYAYRRHRLHSLASLAVSTSHEDVNEAYKASPGKYHTLTINATSRNVWRSSARRTHLFGATAAYHVGRANEYRQERISERDSLTGVTSTLYRTLITYYQRYQVNMADLGAHYKLLLTDRSGQATNAYVGLRADYRHVQNRHLLPTSDFRYSHLTLTASGGTHLWQSNARRLWAEAHVGRHFSLDSRLSLADATTDIALAVMLPRQAYYAAHHWRGGLTLQYDTPLHIKRHRVNGFVRLTADGLTTSRSTSAAHFALSFGLYH